MSTLNTARGGMVPITAFAGAMVIATAATVSAPPALRAAEQITPVVVHKVTPLQVQLTAGYDPFLPYLMPVSLGAQLLTIPVQLVTLAGQAVAQQATRTLTDLHVDARLAQQPELVTSLLVNIAVSLHAAVVSTYLGGTYVYGQFTPSEGLDFLTARLQDVFDAFVAAERALFGLDPVEAEDSPAVLSNQDVSSIDIADEKSVVTLSTVPDDTTQKSVPEQATTEAVHEDGPAEVATSDDAEPVTDDDSVTDDDPVTELDSATDDDPVAELDSVTDDDSVTDNDPVTEAPEPKKASDTTTSTRVDSGAGTSTGDDAGSSTSTASQGTSQKSGADTASK